MHKTSAWPLALTYAALVVYASLYPFADWRVQGIAPWAFLTASWPRYWTGFDVAANVAGYGPLGFLLALSALRTRSRLPAVILATLAAAVLSLLMESLQGFLPVRVASNVDLGLNVLGAWLGAVMAWVMEKLGALDRWSRFRARWFVPEARGALVLLALWPLALLFPAPVPFGLGHVLERLEETLAEWLEDTPFLEWIPLREMELQPLLPGAELLAVMLGALIPCLLGYSVMRSVPRRAALALLAMATGLAASVLSAALSYGPSHAWAWFSLPVQVGVGAAVVAAMLLLPLPRRGAAALALLALVVHLSLLNNAPASAYFAQTLQTWEQGRFIRFHGLAQWLGWLWPYAALAYVLLRLSRGEGHTAALEGTEN
jgi:VanZ family protein